MIKIMMKMIWGKQCVSNNGNLICILATVQCWMNDGNRDGKYANFTPLTMSCNEVDHIFECFISCDHADYGEANFFV